MDFDVKYYFNTLSQKERDIYTKLYCEIMRLQPECVFSTRGLNANRLGEIFSYVGYDNPELYFVNFSKINLAQSLFEIRIRFEYLYSYEEISKLSLRIRSEIQNITSTIHGKDTFEQINHIFDFLTKNIEYDVDAREQKGTPIEILQAHCLIGSILNKKAVCDGIAKAFQIICNKLGIENILVTGNACSNIENGPHAWNVVKIDNSYYHFDVTWDIQTLPEIKSSLYLYFGLSDDEMRYDHSWNSEIVPKCFNNKYNYFKYKKLMYSSQNDLERIIDEGLDSGKTALVFQTYINDNYLLGKDIDGAIFAINRSRKYKYIKGYKLCDVPNKPEMILFLVL